MIREECAARALDIAAGRVAGVVTEAGRIACAQVILAGGAWSSLFARAHGVHIPQLSVRATVAATAPLPEIFAGNAADNRFAFRRRADGGYSLALGSYHDFYIGPDAFRHLGAFARQLKKEPFASRYRLGAPPGYPDGWRTPRQWSPDEASPFEKIRILNPAPSAQALHRIQTLFGETFPHLGKPALRTAWAGMIDTLPDMVPVIDRVASLPGLILGTGMCGHGFGIGPAFGRILAHLAMGRTPGHDLTAFRFSRFSDGSKLTPGAAL